MKKLGVFLPMRSSLTRFDRHNPGIFLEDVGNAILAELRKSFELVEGLNFLKASVRDGVVFFGGLDSTQLDGFVWFSQMDRYSDSHDFLVLRQLEKSMPVMNPTRGLEIGVDKFKTSSFLKEKGLPAPKFALLESGDEESIEWVFNNWGSVLVKPRFGFFGLGIFKADNADEFLDLLDYSGQSSAYVEKFYENDFNDWCSVNVVGGKVLYGFAKQPEKIKGFKVLDRKQTGGKTIERKPDKEQEKIALRVAMETGLDFLGVDIIKSVEGEYLVVDVNTFPGIYTEIMPAAQIAGEFARAVRQKVQ
ncbi:MAG TPA: hypothetical protein VJA40_04455 [archaeon]|nr:hypothetical protein [archaeon]